MNARPLAFYLGLILLIACSASVVLAADPPRISQGGSLISGGSAATAKAGGDTINLMSTHNDPTNGPGEPAYYGDFEDEFGNPDWNGWTHRDLTQTAAPLWDAKNSGGVGDFAKIWVGLEDYDSCSTNYSPQVAFIDDGFVVPGTGGSECIDWCYGPGGFMVNNTGGLAGDEAHLDNVVESPVMAWPGAQSPGDPGPDGAVLAFSVYRHENLSVDSPGIFYTWKVRSADTDNSGGEGVQDIANQPWKDRGQVYWGGAEYFRHVIDMNGLLSRGRDEVQIQLGVHELGWMWGMDGHNGTPAPYFDNVTFKVFPFVGPAMTALDINLAQDNFPEQGVLDVENPGSNHVRFDMAKNIATAGEMRNVPGDSIVVDIVSIRAGAELVGPPRLHYMVDQNPDFDPYRTAGLPASGSVEGFMAGHQGSAPEPGKWAFDLPDTGFLFPGDVLHYYISATDAIGGAGGSQPQTSTLPANTTGFGYGFADPLSYDTSFTFRALPSVVLRHGGLNSPGILFIDDAGSADSEEAWMLAFYDYCPGVDFDVYHVNGSSSGVGNGIGGRANAQVLALYNDIIYTSGDQWVYTLSEGDFFWDAGDDIGTLTEWLDLGDKDLFLAGDGLASDLDQQGSSAGTFLLDYMGLNVLSDDIKELIGNQTVPRVAPVEGLPISDQIFNLTSWVVYGGCPNINRFDAVEAFAGSIRQAGFLDPSGNVPPYRYAAATLNRVGTSRIISMPMDLRFVLNDPSAGNTKPAQSWLLGNVLWFMGYEYYDCPGDAGDDLPAITFQVGNQPNPFNPLTTIHYSMPRAGRLELNIYNVRGLLIRKLVDEVRPVGENQTVVWDGTDSRGASVSSGIYFYQAIAGGEEITGKMALLK